MSISANLGASAAPIVIHYNGRDYACGALTYGVMSAFERLVQDKTREELFALKPLLPADEWNARLDAFLADCGSFKFAFTGEVCAKLLQTKAGILKLASLLFSVDERELIVLAQAKPEEFEAVVNQVVTEGLCPKA